MCVFLAVSILIVGLAAWTAHVTFSGREQEETAGMPTGAEASLTQLAAEMEPVLVESRRVLLGQRPDGDPTCVARDLLDNRVVLQGSPNGGIGLRFVAFYAQSPESPVPLYEWSQGELRSFVRGERDANALLLAKAQRLATAARELAAAIHGGALPVAEAIPNSPTWPAECLRRLTAAASAGDLASAKVWADELAAATFALADLHRWLNVLLDVHIASLDFQAQCRTAFEWAQANTAQRPTDQESCLPAAGQMVPWSENYLEVERQAEGLFWPSVVAAEIAGSLDLSSVPAARWMPPDLRRAFLSVRSRLSPATQVLWDRAAAAPYERSYLANMLFRSASTNTLEQMALVLQRFEQSHAAATTAELMDVLFYRAGLYSSGFPWSDRYDSRIISAAGSVAGPRDLAIRRAHRLVNSILNGWENYSSGTTTLAQCLDALKLDCVRGTDLVGALYRGAGQSEYYVVRLSCGIVGHSVGAVPIEDGGERSLLIVDCLDSQTPAETWPKAYFHGMTWPVGYPGIKGRLFSAELYARGLDGCLFAEGCVVRGDHAGQWMRASLPYLPGREQAASEKIFEGPFPE